MTLLDFFNHLAKRCEYNERLYYDYKSDPHLPHYKNPAEQAKQAARRLADSVETPHHFREHDKIRADWRLIVELDKEEKWDLFTAFQGNEKLREGVREYLRG